MKNLPPMYLVEREKINKWRTVEWTYIFVTNQLSSVMHIKMQNKILDYFICDNHFTL